MLTLQKASESVNCIQCVWSCHWRLLEGRSISDVENAFAMVMVMVVVLFVWAAGLTYLDYKRRATKGAPVVMEDENVELRQLESDSTAQVHAPSMPTADVRRYRDVIPTAPYKPGPFKH